MDLELAGKRRNRHRGNRGHWHRNRAAAGARGRAHRGVQPEPEPGGRRDRVARPRDAAKLLIPAEVELKSADSVAAMVDSVTAAFGGVDILINSGADVSGNVAEDFAHITDEFVLSAFEDKFVGDPAHLPERGAADAPRRLGPDHQHRREHGPRGGAHLAGARNAAVVNLTKTLATELGRDGITVNAIHPFTTVTENLDGRLERMAARRGHRRGGPPQAHLRPDRARAAGDGGGDRRLRHLPRLAALHRADRRGGRAHGWPGPLRLLLTSTEHRRYRMSSTVPAIEELSERSALDALLRPRSVAMIGASRNPTALGAGRSASWPGTVSRARSTR